MATFPIPPTYAPPFIKSPTLQDPQRVVINPIWLSWFLEAAAQLSPGATDHETLANLFGGAANDHYHLTQAQRNGLLDGSSQAVVTPAVGASPWTYQNATSYYQILLFNGGTAVTYQYSTDNVTFYGLPAGLFILGRGHYIKVTYTAAPTLTGIYL